MSNLIYIFNTSCTFIRMYHASLSWKSIALMQRIPKLCREVNLTHVIIQSQLLTNTEHSQGCSKLKSDQLLKMKGRFMVRYPGQISTSLETKTILSTKIPNLNIQTEYSNTPRKAVLKQLCIYYTCNIIYPV